MREKENETDISHRAHRENLVMVFAPVIPVYSVRDTLCFSLYLQIPKIFRIGLLIFNQRNRCNLRIVFIGLAMCSLLPAFVADF